MNRLNSKRIQNDEEDDERRRNCTIVILLFGALAAAAFAVGIVALIRSSSNGQDAVAREALAVLQAQVNQLGGNCSVCDNANTTSLQMQLDQIIPNETIIREGRFIWNIASSADAPVGCTGAKKTVPGYTLVSGGTGYRVDDLFTVADSTADYQNQPVLQITSVGGSGEVLSFIVLGQGCLNAVPVGNLTFQTFSVVGTGLTVQMWAGAYTPTPTDVYYTFNEEIAQRWVAAPQFANYSLRRVVVGQTESTVLVMDPPELPLTTQYPVGLGPFATTYITVQAYAWSSSSDIPYLGDTEVFYLTQSNVAAISLVDDTSCYSNGSPCQLNGYSGIWPYNIPAFKNSISAFTWGVSGYTNQMVYRFYFTTDNSVTYDYVANNAVLTLNSPIRLVIAQS